MTAIRHTAAGDLESIVRPSGFPLLLHPRAAMSLRRALDRLTDADRALLLAAVTSSFRSWEKQTQMIERYKRAIGSATWVRWRDLTPDQLKAARRAGFAYHPGFPKDEPHTHVGGGALDIRDVLPAHVRAALEGEGFRRDTPGDRVHWGWHGA